MSEEELKAAVQVAFHHGLVVEAAGAAGLAAFLSGKVKAGSLQPWCRVLSRTFAGGSQANGLSVSVICILLLSFAICAVKKQLQNCLGLKSGSLPHPKHLVRHW